MEEQVHLLDPVQTLNMAVVPVGYPGWADQAQVSYVSWGVCWDGW